MNRKTYGVDCFWIAYVIFCRTWAIATTFGFWAVGVEAVYYHHLMGIYLLCIATLMSCLESVFLINYFVIICIDATSLHCLRFWDIVLWFDDWKKGLFYLVLAAACFVQPHVLWLALIAGGMLIVSGILYSIKSIYTRREERQRSSKIPSYNRFDEIPDEEIEDDIVNPIVTSSPIPSVGDQSEILNL